MKLFHGDCLIESDNIESGSVDLILTDLPYGTVGESMQDNTGKYSKINKSKWDNIIPTEKIMQIADRILRKNGKMLLFCQQPFTTNLINNAIPSLSYSYTIFWDKLHFANCLGANKAMVNYMEECLLFTKGNPKHDFEGLHPLREYFLTQKSESRLNYIEIKKILGNKMASHYFTNGSQFCLPTKPNYIKLQTTGYFKRDWDELKEIDNIYRYELLRRINKEYPSTFNLWEGNKYKSNILKYKKDYSGHHPTQKPVLLLEDLIKTFSNENNLVVDLTMGSGSTGVASKNTNRNFIGIEMDDKYFEIAKDRIENNGSLF